MTTSIMLSCKEMAQKIECSNSMMREGQPHEKSVSGYFSSVIM